MKRTTFEVDNNCDTLYIGQNYFRLPRHTIRENSNFIILFPQDMKNLTHIHAHHCDSDISLLEFKQLCHMVWSEKQNFIIIDLTSTPVNGISTGSIFLLVLYKAAIMEAYRSVIMEAFRDQFTATELLSYRGVVRGRVVGMRSVIQTKWTVKTATAHV